MHQRLSWLHRHQRSHCHTVVFKPAVVSTLALLLLAKRRGRQDIAKLLGWQRGGFVLPGTGARDQGLVVRLRLRLDNTFHYVFRGLGTATRRLKRLYLLRYVCQALKQAAGTIRNAVHFPVAVCKAACLSLDALEQRRDEVGQAPQAIGSIVVLPEERTSRRLDSEVAELRLVHSIQVPVGQFLHKQEELRSRAWRGCSFLMHLVQRWHQGVLHVADHGWFRALQLQNLWAVVIRVVVRMKHCQRPEDFVHSTTKMVQPHLVPIGERHGCSGKAQVPQRRAHLLIPSGADEISV